MTVKPLPNIKDLINDINNLVSKHRKPTDVEIYQLKKYLDSLKNKISWADYYDILGQISGLANNKEEMISFFEKSIRLEPNNYEIHRNHLFCLLNHGLIDLAINQAKLLNDRFSETQDSLSLLSKSYFYLCRFRDALQILDKQQTIDDFIKSSVAIFDNAKITDDEAQNLCELAFSLLKKKRLYFSAITLDIIESCVVYTIYVDVSIEQLTEINWELAGIFAKGVTNMRSNVLMFEYSSIDILEQDKFYECVV